MALGLASTAQAQGLLSLDQPALAQVPGYWACQSSVFALSDPVPLRGMIDRWQGGYTAHSAPLAMGNWGGRLQGQAGPWSVSIWDLTTLLGEMSPGGARLLWLTKQRQTLPVGETFDIRLKLDALHRSGTTVGRAWTFGQVTLGAGLSCWTATGAQFGTARGQGTATGLKTYSFNVDIDYAYNQNRLYSLAVPSERGMGFGLNLGARWTQDSWEWQWSARDVGNQTHWARLPKTTALALSNRSHMDINGYLLFDPSIEGWEGERPLTWREPVAWSTSIGRSFSALTTRFRLERFGPVQFQTLELEYPFSSTLISMASFETRTRLWTLGANYRMAWVRIGLSSLAARNAHALQLEAGIRGRW